MIEKIKSIKNKVLEVLREYPEARDNDRFLIAKIWHDQNNIPLDSISAKKFIRDFIYGRYSDTESIRRSRQKMQELHPELRGTSYRSRSGPLEEEVRTEINTIKE